jgi:enamine deaminase RidA (YjgF/YER057c/UK114 family)
MAAESKLVELVNPDSLMKPRGFSHACVARGHRTLYLAGQVAADKNGVIQHHNDLVRQFDLTLRNFKTCMDTAGARMSQVVKLNYYVLDVGDYLAKRRELGVVYRKYFDRHFPAMTLVEVKGLYNEGALIEIDGVAALDEPEVIA